MTKARDKFSLGDRVRLTRRGQRHLRTWSGQPTTGRVVGFCRSPWSVHILHPKRKRSVSYFAAFWSKRPASAVKEIEPRG